MTYYEALDYIHKNFWQGSKPGLERTEDLLKRLGNPQNDLRFIHVAGTNGKGSFCAMLSSVLTAAGLKVGTYTSPYILRFNERMKINGVDISDGKLVELTEYIKPFADGMEEKPTEFELITALGMEYFKREKCDIVLLECGMGGRLDSTNVIETSVLSVITGISLDHTAFLGDTVEKIATEKAGIIKNSVPCLFCGKDRSALSVISKRAEQMHSKLYTVDRKGLKIKEFSLDGTRFDAENYRDVFIRLLGSYQPQNAQNVLKAVEILNDCGFNISEDAVKIGLKATKWRARYELVKKEPLIICDGGHNPEGVDAAVESTKLYFGNKKVLLVTGVMADKDYRYMTKRLSEVANEAFCLTPNNPRALSSYEYARAFSEKNVAAKGYETPFDAVKAAVEKAKKTGDAILCVGSLYMYGEIIDALNNL